MSKRQTLIAAVVAVAAGAAAAFGIKVLRVAADSTALDAAILVVCLVYVAFALRAELRRRAGRGPAHEASARRERAAVRSAQDSVRAYEFRTGLRCFSCSRLRMSANPTGKPERCAKCEERDVMRAWGIKEARN